MSKQPIKVLSTQEVVKLFIDAGHGGKDSGAVGFGLFEKNLTLAISKKVRDILKDYDGIEVKLSREKDETLTLKQRTDMANKWGADYLISVHINSAVNVSAEGYEDFTYKGTKGRTVERQNTMHEEITKQIPDMKNRGKKQADFHMLRESNMEAILTESGFISNKTDADKLRSDAYLNKIAQGHANGVIKIFKLKKKAEKKQEPKKEAPKVVFESKPYEVVKGDTLTKIAKDKGTTVDILVKDNNLINANVISVGQKLKIRKK